jgi:hypothetical protein
MADYESFWLATAAAAPVIALAAVVALPDTSDVSPDVIQSTLDEWFSSPERISSAAKEAGASDAVVKIMAGIDPAALKGVAQKVPALLRVVTVPIRWIAICNVILQAALLAVALGALAYNMSVIPRWVAIALTVGGILLLATTVSLSSEYLKEAKKFGNTLEEQTVRWFRNWWKRISSRILRRI